jgi:hypothetical protein
MKTRFNSPVALMILSVGMMITSCSKEELTLNPPVINVPNTNVPTVQSAVIQDKGLMDGINRLFVVTLTNLDVLVNSSTNELTGRAGEISFELYSDADGLVPSGAYYFDKIGNNQPFTFNYGFLKALDVSGSKSDMFVSSGVVNVSHDATGYQFSFDCKFKSGYAVQGQYSGDASYEDVSMK